MKNINLIILLLIVVSFISSCSKDNYDAPSSLLEGRLLYNGDPINVNSSDVSFQLWELGWQKNFSLTVNVAQDGSYSSMLFDGTYKLIIPANQGPFKSLTNDETGNDTILVEMNGSKTLDIEVQPYYMVRDAQFSVNGKSVTGTFRAEKIVTGAEGRDIEKVYLYVNRTMFVGNSYNIANAEKAGADIRDSNAISMTLTVPDLNPTQSYLYARVGIKIAGVEDMIFSPVQKIDL